MVNQEVIEKLQKILALANDPAASTGEMEAALGRAKEVALRYGVNLASVPTGLESKKGPSLKVETNTSLVSKTRFKHAYHDPIFNVLMEVFGVRILLTKHRNHSSTHVSISNIYVIGDGKVTGRDRSSQNGFFWGLASGLIAVNKREEAKLDKEEYACWALVVRSKQDLIDQAIKEQFPDMREARKTKLDLNFTAHRHGQQAGEKINLRQVTPAGNKERIEP